MINIYIYIYIKYKKFNIYIYIYIYIYGKEDNINNWIYWIFREIYGFKFKNDYNIIGLFHSESNILFKII